MVMQKKQRTRTDLSERASHIGSVMDKAKDASRAQISRTANTTRKAVQKRPLTAVGVAAGTAMAVGIIAGVSLARRGKDDEDEAFKEEED